MSTSGSVSKGCFAFPGKRKQARAEDFLEASKQECSTECYHTYKLQWQHMEEAIQFLQAEISGQIFDDLLKFTEAAHSNNPHDKTVREIPTAALITGVNVTDHDDMFSNLTAMLKDRVTSHVALLKSKDGTNLKTLVGKTLSQLMASGEMLLDDEDRDQDTLNIKRISPSISVLASWYSHISTLKKQISSPRKRNSSGAVIKEGSTRPPVVIILQDIEGFPAHVLQDFITICHNYLSQIPFVFVFGIATTVTAVHKLLPHAVSSLLCLEKFQALPATEHLSQVIDTVLLTDRFPFKLSSKVFKLILDTFLYHDFSIHSFIKALQFCMLEHYTMRPISLLCCDLEEAEERVESLTAKQIDQFRTLLSFRRYVECCPPKDQISLLTDSVYTKKRILHMLARLGRYHSTFFPVLRCLHYIVGSLPGYPLGKQLREVYSCSLERNICETEGFKESLQILRNLSRDELFEKLTKCLEYFTSDEAYVDVAETLLEFASKLQSGEDLGALYESADSADSAEEEQKSTALPKKTDMYTLRKSLQELGKRKKKLTIFEKLRSDILDYLETVFRKFLPCPRSLPLHEIFYYDDITTVRGSINGAPRLAIQTALSNPTQYLQCNCCSVEGGIEATLPDICKVYKLHVECGRLINLYDWLQAFTMVTSGEEASSPDKQMQARFIRAVSEMQFLGFIKPTKRKTDHVARLTWGGC